MATNLYPLIYKPGIKRDGTLFQADYCTEGNWVRFQRGNVRKMGGMKGINDPSIINLLNTSNIRVIPSIGNDNTMITYIADTNGIKRYVLNPNFSFLRAQNVNPAGFIINSPDAIWDSTTIIQGENRRIVYLGSTTRRNINNNDESLMLYGDLFGNDIILKEMENLPPLAGAMGLLFVNPFLFIYGSNGRFQWSKRENPLDFTNVADRTFSVADDKIICARAVRGGVNSPVILCWTLSSVVRLINRDQGDGNLHFEKDVLSTTSSALSSRSIVEYDGLFFWPGTNRFFQYNGLVAEVPNTMSLNFFYENLDLDYRQLVFGVKNTLYGEIWWYFPKKGQDANVGIKNNHALIYNIRENSWYDTPISRESGFYSEDYGFLCTYGEALTDETAPTTLYRHEFETAYDVPNAINEQVPIAGQIGLNSNPITSSFTTPTISWAAFNPMKQLTGVDRWMYLITIEPDFALMPPPNPAALDFTGTDMQVVINTREYAQSYPISSPPYQVVSPLVPTSDPKLAKIDTAYQGRHINLTFTTTKNFEMGHIMLSIGIGDGQ